MAIRITVGSRPITDLELLSCRPSRTPASVRPDWSLPPPLPLPVLVRPFWDVELPPGFVDAYGGVEPFIQDPNTITPFHIAQSLLSHTEVVEEVLEEEAPPEGSLDSSDEGYTILDALRDYVMDKYPGKALDLVHRTALCTSYRVVAYDVQTSRAILEGGVENRTLKPVITEREAALYYACWN